MYKRQHVVVAPAEVARGARFHTGAGTSGNGVHHDIIVQHQMFGERQQAQLYAGGKAARIGYVLRFAGGTAVQLRQAVDAVSYTHLDVYKRQEKGSVSRLYSE